MAIAAGEDIVEKGDGFVVHQSVVGQDVTSANIQGRAAHVGADAAGFADQQNSRGHVPWIELEFPKHVQSATGDVCQIQRRRSRTPDAVRLHRELIEKMYVDVLV